MTRDIAILDFGSGRITVLIGRRGVNGTLLLSGSYHEEYAGFSEGQWLRPELIPQAVASALAAAEAEAGIKIKHLYIGVPAEFSACVVRETTLSLPKRRKITSADVEKLYELGTDFLDDAPGFTLINRQPVYFTLDDDRRTIEPVGLSSGKISGLLSYILAENRFTNFIDNIMESMGMESAEFISSPLASAMFLLDELKRDRSAVLVDIGFITSSVAVVRGDGLLSLGSFSLGGGHIAGDLAQYFGISFTDAEALKRKVDLSLLPSAGDVYEVRGTEFDAELVSQIISARIATISKAIGVCLSQNKYELPDSAQYYLTGGGIGFMRGAHLQLSQNLSKEFELALPPIPQMDKPDLSASLGLLNIVLDSGEPEKRKKKGFLSKILGG